MYEFTSFRRSLKRCLGTPIVTGPRYDQKTKGDTYHKMGLNTNILYMYLKYMTCCLLKWNWIITCLKPKSCVIFAKWIYMFDLVKFDCSHQNNLLFPRSEIQSQFFSFIWNRQHMMTVSVLIVLLIYGKNQIINYQMSLNALNRIVSWKWRSSL